MKYIDAEKLIAEIERRIESWDIRGKNSPAGQGKDTCESRVTELSDLLSFIASLQQEQPEGKLEYWLKHFGMPKENIDNCITQIAQGYGASRYLEGVQHGAEAVNELAQQELPEVDLEKEIKRFLSNATKMNKGEWRGKYPISDIGFRTVARHFWNKGYNARKEE